MYACACRRRLDVVRTTDPTLNRMVVYGACMAAHKLCTQTGGRSWHSVSLVDAVWWSICRRDSPKVEVRTLEYTEPCFIESQLYIN